jgi:hypothetical protein
MGKREIGRDERDIDGKTYTRVELGAVTKERE